MSTKNDGIGITFNLEAARALVDLFGGEDAEVEVSQSWDGHSGRGLYAHFVSCPEEGSVYLGDPEEAFLTPSE